jgi:antitoxin component HigA of HigAB toxin-antitoxin module
MAANILIIETHCQELIAIINIDGLPDFRENSIMDDGLDWIRRGLERPGKTQAGLAKAFGRSPSAINNLLRGRRRLRTDEIAKAARYLEVAPPPLLSGEDFTHVANGAPTVPVIGYVGAGGLAHRYAVGHGNLDRISTPDASAETVAVEVRGDSLGSSFDRWLVFYDDVANPVTDDLIGKLCVVGLSDDRVLIKTIRRGRRPGLFVLESNTEPPINDTPLEWAAQVRAMRPRG